MKIPEIRARLIELAEELGCQELADLAEATKRRPCVRKAPRQRRRVTSITKEAVFDWVANHPQEDYQTIGQRFNIGAGRVSEIVAGFKE